MINFEWLSKQQSETPRFFTQYEAKPWRPQDTAVIQRFHSACVKKQGPIVLWDVFHALKRLSKIRPDIPCIQYEDLMTRSQYSPDSLRPFCEKLETSGKMGAYDGKILQQAFEKCKRMFYTGKVKPLDLGEVPYQAKTNAGLPTFLPKAEVYPQAVQAARAVVRGKAPEALTMFHRGRNTAYEDALSGDFESRGVNGYPFEMTLLEGRFFYPVQSELMQHHNPYAGGRLNFETAGLLNELKWKSRFIVELDYSKFDITMPSKLINMAFRIIEQNLDLSDPEDAKTWQIVTRYFVTAPVLCPDGNIYKGRRHAVPSGSMFTQMVDSIVNAIVIEYVARKLNFMTSRYTVLGDDSVIGVDRPVEITQISEAAKELGITVNTDKSTVHVVSEDIHFLGHDWTSFIAVRDIKETLIRLCCPERGRNEYWSKTRDVRENAFIERIRAYQDDNPSAFHILGMFVSYFKRSVELREGHASVMRLQPEFVEYYFQGAEKAEQARWRPAVRHRETGPSSHRGLVVFT